MNAAQRQLVLEQELRQVPLDTVGLPALVDEKSWLTKFFEDLFAFMVDKLPESEWNPDLEALALLWNVLKYSALFLFCIAVIYFIYVVWRHVRGDLLGGLPSSGLASAQPNPLALASRLEDAVSMGDWGLALRLRWQLALAEIGRPPSATVHEAIFAGWFAAVDGDAIVRGMFRPGSGSEQLFREFDQQLHAMRREGTA